MAKPLIAVITAILCNSQALLIIIVSTQHLKFFSGFWQLCDVFLTTFRWLPFNLLNPKISVNILHTALHIFPVLLMGRIS